MKKIKVAVDIGNSNVVIGLNLNNEWIKIYRLSTKKNFTYWSFQKKIKRIIDLNDFNPSHIDKIVISSVVPTLTDIVKISCSDMLCKDIYIVKPASVNNLKILIDDINEIGTDLLSNAVQASELYDDNIIVVDFGTALTFTAVSNNRELLGVNIVPGLKTAINSLYKNTANLPVINLDIPERAIGKNTVQSMQSGIMYGYIGLIKEIIYQIKNELVGETKVIATGGLSKFAKPLNDQFNDIIPTLTIDGMMKILLDQEKK